MRSPSRPARRSIRNGWPCSRPRGRASCCMRIARRSCGGTNRPASCASWAGASRIRSSSPPRLSTRCRGAVASPEWRSSAASPSSSTTIRHGRPGCRPLRGTAARWPSRCSSGSGPSARCSSVRPRRGDSRRKRSACSRSSAPRSRLRSRRAACSWTRNGRQISTRSPGCRTAHTSRAVWPCRSGRLGRAARPSRSSTPTSTTSARSTTPSVTRPGTSSYASSASG